MAKNTKTASEKTAEKAGKYAVPYGVKKAQMAKDVEKEFGGLLYHNCTIDGGRKLEKGTHVVVKWVGVTRRLRITSMCILDDGGIEWIDPRHLVKGKPIDAKTKALYEAEREALKEETVIVAGRTVNENDKSFCFDHTGWGFGIWFPKEKAERVGTMPDGRLVFEVPAFPIRRKGGQDGVDALNAKRKEIEKAMVPFDGTEPDLSEAA